MSGRGDEHGSLYCRGHNVLYFNGAFQITASYRAPEVVITDALLKYSESSGGQRRMPPFRLGSRGRTAAHKESLRKIWVGKGLSSQAGSESPAPLLPGPSVPTWLLQRGQLALGMSILIIFNYCFPECLSLTRGKPRHRGTASSLHPPRPACPHCSGSLPTPHPVSFSSFSLLLFFPSLSHIFLPFSTLPPSSPSAFSPSLT